MKKLVKYLTVSIGRQQECQYFMKHLFTILSNSVEKNFYRMVSWERMSFR